MRDFWFKVWLPKIFTNFVFRFLFPCFLRNKQRFQASRKNQHCENRRKRRRIIGGRTK